MHEPPSEAPQPLPRPPARAAAPDDRRALIARYLPPVYALCFRLLRDVHAAEDAVQETFLAAIAIWDTVQPVAPADSERDPRLQWLLAIAAHRALRLRRQRHREQVPLETSMSVTDPLTSATTSATPADAAVQRETLAELEQALDALPEDERQVVVLQHLHGLTQAEIARSLELSPRAISRLAQDGLATLRQRLSARGVSAALPLAALFIHLPTPAAPAGLAAHLLAHPVILAWSSSTAAATASTAAAGGAGATPGAAAGAAPSSHAAASVNPVAHGGSAAGAKGATIMSSKLFLGAGAALLGAAFFAWSLGRFDPPPGASQPGPVTPLSAAPASPVTVNTGGTATKTTATSAATPAPSAAAAAMAAATQPAPADANPPGDAPAGITPAQREAAFLKFLTPAQAAERAAFLHAGDTPPEKPTALDLCEHNWTDVNTTLGTFDGEEWAKYSGERSGNLRMLAAAAEAVPPFDWNRICVDRSWFVATQRETVRQTRRVDVTSFGRRIAEVHSDLTVDMAPASVPLPLDPTDVWPQGVPARYDLKSVGDRVGLILTGPGELENQLAAVQAAEQKFFTTARAWLAAQAAYDPQAMAKAGEAGWVALLALEQQQEATCKLLAKRLREEDGSDANGWATLAVAGRRSDPLEPLPPMNPTPLELPDITSREMPPEKPMVRDFDFRLEAHGETLEHLTYLFAKNLNTPGCSVHVDPAVSHFVVEGVFTGDSVEAVLKNLAKSAPVACQADGNNAWKLVPKPDTGKPTGGEGF